MTCNSGRHVKRSQLVVNVWSLPGRWYASFAIVLCFNYDLHKQLSLL